jgi:tripartite-type tricarboxylate transporter receptor subunit TctC
VISTTLTTAATQIRAGRARGLAISAPSRLPEFPDLPTYAEMGYPDLVATVWFSLSGPAGMPGGIVNRLNAGINRALEQPDVRERLKPEGIVPSPMSAREFTAFVAEELARWAPVVRASGAKND